MIMKLLVVLTLLLLGIVAVRSDKDKYKGDTDPLTECKDGSTRCDDGHCCRDDYYCCEDWCCTYEDHPYEDHPYHAIRQKAGFIVAIVIVVIFGVSFCCLCACYLMQRSQRPGMVVNPNNGSVIQTAPPQKLAVPYEPYGQAPPQYTNVQPPPPAYYQTLGQSTLVLPQQTPPNQTPPNQTKVDITQTGVNPSA